MGDKSQNIPLNARIVAKNGNSFMYQTPSGGRFVYNSTTGNLRKAEASDEIQLKSASITDFGGHNSEWATNAIITYKGKSLDSWWKQPQKNRTAFFFLSMYCILHRRKPNCFHYRHRLWPPEPHDRLWWRSQLHNRHRFLDLWQ